MFLRLLRQFFIDESAQGFTEYAAILAFVAVAIAFAFSLRGPLAEGISNSFSACSNQLNSLASVS